ncbi:MAG: transposase, partial [Sutterellaceae bacterium]|nr:transposase [Sutterellaceae bacterium]
KSHPNWSACRQLCSFSRKLGNCAVYTLRQRFFAKEPVMSRSELDNELKAKYPQDYRAMPSAASAQRQGQIVAKQFKSFAKAKAEYKKHPEKFKGEPKLPGYKTKYRTFFVGRNGYQIKDGMLTITGGQEFGLKPIPVRCCQNQVFNAKATDAVAGDLRIVPLGNSFAIELTYHVIEEKPKESVKLDPNFALVCDPGIDNFVTIVSTKPGVKPCLIKGTGIKSLNQKYNKEKAQLQSKMDKLANEAKEVKGDKKQPKNYYDHIRIKGEKRDRQINDWLHKASNLVIQICLTYDLGKIVFGLNPDWKQKVNLGAVNNQKFVMLPHKKFIDMVKYKAQSHGIEVIVREESYTSQASALDFDEIPTYGESFPQKPFSGTRIERGLYKSSTGQEINADVNGAINIGRKEFGNEWLEKRLMLDRGVLDMPVAIRNLHTRVDIGTLLEVRGDPYESPRV